MKKYVLIPGKVRSKHDGQTHYIGAMALARLYGVAIRDCEVFEPASWWGPSQWRFAQERNAGLIELRPRFDGNYELPTE